MRRLFLALFALSFGAIGVFALDSSEIRSDHDSKPAAKQYDDPREAIAKVPAFVTDPSTDRLIYYPCSNCHGEMVKSNPKVRSLADMHVEVKLNHGQGRYWCLTCHNENDRDHLWSLKKQPISFNESYLLCGQCHFARQKDFFYGGHGKRKANWNGPKKLTNCTECHNPHNPAIRPRVPRVKPVARMGLEVVPSEMHGVHNLWEKHPGSEPTGKEEPKE
ncbi:MAG: cytochrome C [bacterium]|nr:cytochrome C [bacterium]